MSTGTDRGARVESHIAALQAAWPPEVVLRPDAAPVFWGRLPEHLAPAFPRLGDSALDPLTTYCGLFIQFVLDQDLLLDGQCAPDAVGPTAMRMLALGSESDAILRELFPARSPFWAAHRRYLSEHAATYWLERSFRRGERPLSAYTEALALRTAGDKMGLARIVVSAMAELAGTPEVVAPLSEAIACVGEALGMRDDLKDWRLDLRDHQPSLLLARTLVDWPAPMSDAEWAAFQPHVARAIHLGGHSRHVLSLAVESLDHADRLLAGFPPMSWFGCVDTIRDASRHELAEIERTSIELLEKARPGASAERHTWAPPPDATDARRHLRPWRTAPLRVSA